MLRFYNIFKLVFLCGFWLRSQWRRGVLVCFSVTILCWKKNNLVKSVTFLSPNMNRLNIRLIRVCSVRCLNQNRENQDGRNFDDSV